MRRRSFLQLFAALTVAPKAVVELGPEPGTLATGAGETLAPTGLRSYNEMLKRLYPPERIVELADRRSVFGTGRLRNIRPVGRWGSSYAWVAIDEAAT